jgi:hypothetical protein
MWTYKQGIVEGLAVNAVDYSWLCWIACVSTLVFLYGCFTFLG